MRPLRALRAECPSSRQWQSGEGVIGAGGCRPHLAGALPGGPGSSRKPHGRAGLGGQEALPLSPIPASATTGILDLGGGLLPMSLPAWSGFPSFSAHSHKATVSLPPPPHHCLPALYLSPPSVTLPPPLCLSPGWKAPRFPPPASLLCLQALPGYAGAGLIGQGKGGSALPGGRVPNILMQGHYSCGVQAGQATALLVCHLE